MTAFSSLISKTLTNDLKWRESELSFLFKQLISTNPGSTQEQALLRANLTMIYAHYEGFCKFALGEYIDALEKLKLKRIQLKWKLATFSMTSFHKELLNETNQADFFTKLFNEFDLHINEVATYSRPEQISNLWPDLLASWLNKLDLDDKCVNDEHVTLEALVTHRNQIAHGKKLTVSNRGELIKYSKAATLAMHQVAVGIVDALDRQSYRRHSLVHTILGHSI